MDHRFAVSLSYLDHSHRFIGHTALIGLDAIFGAFIFGLVIPRTSHLMHVRDIAAWHCCFDHFLFKVDDH